MNLESTDSYNDISAFISQIGLSVRATHVLLQFGFKSVAEFSGLDENTLLRRRNCGKKTTAEIMEAVARVKSSIERTRRKQADAAAIFAAMERVPVADLRLSVRVMSALEYLKISTVDQLLRVSDHELLDLRNFGKRSFRELQSKLNDIHATFVLWPAEQHVEAGLSSHITRAARKLHRLRNASAILHDDSRFGHLIREIRLDAKNAREAADMIIRRKADPIDPKPLIQRLTDLVRVLKVGNARTIEAELWSLTEALGSDRDRRMIVSHLGWDGKPPRTLEAVGRLHKMTRERVRQICTRIEKVQSSRPFAPALDRAIKAVARAAPALADEIETQLLQRRITKTAFCVESLTTIAQDLGRQPHFSVRTVHGHRIVVPVDSGDFLTASIASPEPRSAIGEWRRSKISLRLPILGSLLLKSFCLFRMDSNGLMKLLGGFGWTMFHAIPCSPKSVKFWPLLPLSTSANSERALDAIIGKRASPLPGAC